MTRAFEPVYPTDSGQEKGITKLEFFAVEALKGLCANPVYATGEKDLGPLAVEHATDLIAALNAARTLESV